MNLKVLVRFVAPKIGVAAAVSSALLIAAYPNDARASSVPQTLIQLGEPEGACRRPNRSGWDRFGDGGSGDRRCVVDLLRASRRANLMSSSSSTQTNLWPNLLLGSEVLGEYYLARSDRLQTYLDGGSAATGLGALGASLSTKAGPGTVAAWGYVALAGILTVNFTGSEPMRDLYFAGHLGVGYIENRYVVLANRRRLLGALPASGGSAGCHQANGSRVVDQHLAAVEAWPDAADKAAFLPILRDLSAVCRRVEQGEQRLGQMLVHAAAADLDWPAGFAGDLLALDTRLSDRDAHLRATPSSALTSAAVGALRVVDSLISGENTQDAINRVRINTILDDMTVELTPINLPSPPPTIDSGVSLSTDFETRAGFSGRTRVASARPLAPRDSDVSPIAAWVRNNQAGVEAARLRYNERVLIAVDLHETARRSVLQFDYDVETGSATVRLSAPAGSPAATAPAPASSKPTESGPQVQPQPAD